MSKMASSSVPPCVMCNSSTAKFCSSCHSASYCSVECQRADWSLHKLLCKSMNDFTPRPSSKHKLTILLPHDSQDPQLTWIECERHFEDTVYESAETEHIRNVEKLDPQYDRAIESKDLNYNVLRKFAFNHTIRVICRETFLIDGSSPNACVRRITRGKMTHDWRGPILLMRRKGTPYDASLYEDVTASDLRATVDYFLTYGNRYQ